MARSIKTYIFLLLLLVGVFCAPVWGGTAYYCDCTVTGGTAGAGTFADPFESIADIEAGPAGGWANGDDVYLLKDSTCTIDTTAGSWAQRFDVTWAGVDSDDYMIIGCYEGEGDWCEPGEYATIDGSMDSWDAHPDPGESGYNVDCMRINGSYIKITNLQIQDCLGNGLVFADTDNVDDASYSNVIIEYNKIHDTGKNSYIDYQNGYVCCTAQCGPTYWPHTFTIQNNEFYNAAWGYRQQVSEADVDWAGCGFAGYPQVLGLHAYNSVARYNYIHDSMGEGILFRTLNTQTGNVVEYNHIANVWPSAMGIYRGQDHIVRYNLIVGYAQNNWQDKQESWSTCSGTIASRRWSAGILINPHHADTIDDIYIYGNAVIGANYGISWNDCGDCQYCDPDHSEDIASTTYVYNNSFIDNCFTFKDGDDSDATITFKNNITYHHSGVGGVVDNGMTDATITKAYNLWKAQPDAEWYDAGTDTIGSPYLNKTSGWQSLTVKTDYTTANLMLESNSLAISAGVDLGGTATCADIDNLGTNCGLKMDASTNFHVLPTTVTVAWQDQGDTSVDIGPWTYSAGDPEQPANKGEICCGAILQSTPGAPGSDVGKLE